MERRDFLKTMSAGAGASVAATGFLASVATPPVAASNRPRLRPRPERPKRRSAATCAIGPWAARASVSR